MIKYREVGQAGRMPGATGFTLAVFELKNVPVGTRVFVIDPPAVAEQDKNVHTEHCCLQHGCKYGHDDICPVATGEQAQSYPCEECIGDN